MLRVIIAQEYVPEYRVLFFELLHDRALKVGIDVQVAHGSPNGSQAQRGDIGLIQVGIPLRQHEMRIAGRRMVIRRTRAAFAGADMIVLEQARRNLDSYLLLARNGRRRPPAVALWGHGEDFTRTAAGIDRWLQRWLTSKADWFFSYTRGGADALLKSGFAPERLTVVQNSIDTRGLQASLRSVVGPRVDAFALEHDLRGKTAIFLGALDDSKRLPFLIDSAIAAHSLEPDFRLLIGGDGRDRAFVESEAAKYPWLTYLGSLNGDDKALALEGSQVLAMPGRVGLVAVDSFASATPIVTTRWPWHAPEFEYLEDGVSALITDDSPEAFAADLVNLLQSTDLLDRLRRGCEIASNIYTVETFVDNFLAGLVSALKARRP